MDGRLTLGLIAIVVGFAPTSRGEGPDDHPEIKIGGFVGSTEGVSKAPIDVEKEAPGKLPEGFHSFAGRWEVVQDGKNRVFAQLAKNPDDTFNVALREAFCRNIDIRVRLRAVAGELDRGGGVIWRAKDAGNDYIARYNPLESNFRVYKVEAGKRTQLAAADLPGDDKWHTLRVTMIDDRIVCSLDGKKYLEARDRTFRGAGGVGLWTKSDARTYFDDLAYFSFE